MTKVISRTENAAFTWLSMSKIAKIDKKDSLMAISNSSSEG